MWSDKTNLGDIREMDQLIKNILNKVNAKYMLQTNANLYTPRSKDETINKKTKGVMNLLTRM